MDKCEKDEEEEEKAEKVRQAASDRPESAAEPGQNRESRWLGGDPERVLKKRCEARALGRV